MILTEHGKVVQAIPSYVVYTLTGHRDVTYWVGPFGFFNCFEKTKEGKYLISMLKYPEWTDIVKQKVGRILEQFAPWVQLDEDFISIMNWRTLYD